MVMMAQPSYEPVFGCDFIAPHEFNLIVNRFVCGDLVITDIRNTVLFKIRSCDTTFHRQRLLQDGCGRSIAKLRAKNTTAHGRWNVFRGQSTADTDMIFSAAKNNIIQIGTHVKVSLANKKSANDDCDFQIEGNWSDRDCTIYKGYSASIMAQMQLWESPERFLVTVYPKVDYAFVAALIAIADAIESPGTTHAAAGQVATGAVSVATGAVSVAASVGIQIFAAVTPNSKE